MNAADPGEEWTESLRVAQHAATMGHAPAPLHYILYRSTNRPGSSPRTAGYILTPGATPVSPAAFEAWVRSAGLIAHRQLISVLAIDEDLTPGGQIATCTIERRRGDIAGPYVGEPARIEFVGPARRVRLYRIGRDGRLGEYLPEPATEGAVEPPLPRALGLLAGEEQALVAHFGSMPLILERRDPTLFEDLVALTVILHVRTDDGQEIGCGIGWHGSVPFILEADFPRLAGNLMLEPERQPVMEAALSEHGLEPCETRLDDIGLAVIARRRGSDDLFVVRLRGQQAEISPYQQRQAGLGTADQARWMHYAESFEALSILDAWRDGGSADLVVISRDSQGQVSRHYIDPDGIEIGRDPDFTAAAALVSRTPLAPPRTPTAPPEVAPLTEPPIPSDSVLALARAVAHADDLLQAARGAAALGQRDQMLDSLRQLHEPLRTLGARFAAAAVRDLIRVAERASPAGVSSSMIGQLAERLTAELTQLRVMVLQPALPLAVPTHEQSLALEAWLPGAGFHLDEAARCLALRRPTAAVLHGVQLMQRGLAELGRHLGWAPTGDTGWAGIVVRLRTGSGSQPSLAAAIEDVWRCLGSPGLLPADRYTEENAEAVLEAIGGFLDRLGPLIRPDLH